jgi:hypothetical protein
VLRTDARVRQILDVNVDDDRLQPGASAALRADEHVDSATKARTLDVSVSFETASLDRASLKLGKVASGG